MNLSQWVSISFEFLDLLPKNEVGKGDLVKVFGIYWNCVEDYLQINGVDFFNLKILPTKREVLRTIVRILTHWGFSYSSNLLWEDVFTRFVEGGFILGSSTPIEIIRQMG